MPWIRILTAFLAAVLPPVLGMLLLLLGAQTQSPTDRAFAATALLLLSLGWAITLAAIYGRILRSESSQILALAEGGLDADASGEDQPRVVGRLANALADREQQLAVLAREIASSPITDQPSSVLRHVVRATHAVTRDDTWTLAVLGSDGDVLDAGVFDGSDDPAGPLSDLHQWASVTAPPLAPGGEVLRAADGPWGRFMVVPAGSQRVRAVLMAPWEGRAEPSSADAALLRLVGRHAAFTLEHAVLYATVRLQSGEIQRLARVQADFLRGVSHDLQTPLTTIRALASEVRSGSSLSGEAAADLDMIEHQADRLRRMVAQLLTVSRLEAGVVEARQEVFAVQPIVERTWKALRAVDRQFRILATGPAMLAVGDPDRFEQVVWAVLENAVRYSPPGSAVEAMIERQAEASRVILAVRDHGAGMDRETLQHAFDQFYRAPSARASAPDGSGIGLYAARGLMAAMGGSISADSSLGSGATISLILPAEAADMGDDAVAVTQGE